jgi:hypothetical protein
MAGKARCESAMDVDVLGREGLGVRAWHLRDWEKVMRILINTIYRKYKVKYCQHFFVVLESFHRIRSS